MGISEGEKIIRTQFENYIRSGMDEKVLELIESNSTLKYWHMKTAHRIVNYTNNLNIIQLFYSKYDYEINATHILYAGKENEKEALKFLLDNNIKMTEEDIIVALKNGIIIKDKDVVMWAAKELKARGELAYLRQRLNIVYESTVYPYEYIVFLMDNLSINDWPEGLVYSLLFYNDLRYLELIEYAENKGYQLCIEDPWQAFYYILKKTKYFDTEEDNTDTRPERLQYITEKYSNCKIYEDNVKSVLLDSNTYSKRLLEYYLTIEEDALNSVDEVYGNTLLINAIKLGNNQMVTDLLALGADVNAGKRRVGV
jgi:hypothetical protein